MQTLTIARRLSQHTPRFYHFSARPRKPLSKARDVAAPSRISSPAVCANRCRSIVTEISRFPPSPFPASTGPRYSGTVSGCTACMRACSYLTCSLASNRDDVDRERSDSRISRGKRWTRAIKSSLLLCAAKCTGCFFILYLCSAVLVHLTVQFFVSKHVEAPVTSEIQAIEKTRFFANYASDDQMDG